MTEYEGRLEATGRVALVVSRYHEVLTASLLDGALEACRAAGVADADIDVLHVSGAFELGVVAAALAHHGSYSAIVALGAVIRGQTPHFEYVARESAAALGRVATETLTPVGFGLLTCDTVEQAAVRAGGPHGNKGREAAEAALRTADLLRRALEDS